MKTQKLNTGYSWFVVIGLSLAAILSYVDRQIINLLVEPIKLNLGLSDTQISLVQGFSFAIFYAALALPIARLADSGNRTHVIFAGIVCWSLATFSCGLAVGFWTLFFARMFVGAGEATLTPAGYSIIGDYFSKEKLPLAISVFTGSGFLGSGVALMIGAYVIDLVIGWGDVSFPLLGKLEPWQLTFMLVALPSIPMLFIMAFIKEPVRLGVDAAESEAKVKLRQIVQYIFDNKRIYIAIFFGFTLMASAQFGIGAWIPSFFIRTYDWSAPQIGFAFGILATIFSTGGVLVGGWLSTRLIKAGVASANFVVPIAAVILCAPFAAAFPLAGNANASLYLIAPVLFFGAMPFGTGTATLPQIAPNRMRAQVVAIYLLIANLLGFTMGPTIIALLTDRYFADPLLIRYSLSIVPPVLMLCGAAVVFTGLNHYKLLLGSQNAK